MSCRAAAFILLVSTLAWSQATLPPPGCLSPRAPRAAPDQAAEQTEKKGLKERLKGQFSSGCVNVLLGGCWGDQGNKPPASAPGTPQTKDKPQPAPADKPATTEASKQKPDLTFPEEQSRRAQETAQSGVSSSKKNPDLEFPEEQSRRAQDAATGESSSSKGYNPPPPPSVAESDVMEMKPYDPHKAEKDVEVGDFYYKRGNYKAAISRYQEALELGPPSSSTTFKLADALEKGKRLEQAAVYYREYVRQYPNGALSAQARAALDRLAPVVQARGGHLAAAEVARGLEAGETLLAQRNYPAAVERFCDVADLAPDNARALFRLAQALQATGEFAAAYQNYQSYLKLEPDGQFAAAARREVQRLGPQVQQGKVTSPSSETRP